MYRHPWVLPAKGVKRVLHFPDRQVGLVGDGKNWAISYVWVNLKELGR